MSSHREAIAQLDARHDELIQKLDALNADIERVLAEFARSRGTDTHDTLHAEPTAEAPLRRAA